MRKLVSESLKDILKPKSREEVISSFKHHSPNEILTASIKIGFVAGIKNALERGVPPVSVGTWGALSPEDYFRNFLIRNKDEFLGKKPSKNFLNKIFKKSCQIGLFPLLNWSLNKGANINHKDHLGSTPLYHASKHQHFDIVKFLVERGANVNTKNPKGFTPLLANLSHMGFNENIFWYLMDNGANIYVKNKEGMDALSLMFGTKNSAAHKLMDRMDKYTPDNLAKALEKGTLKNVKKIIEKGNFNLNKRIDNKLPLEIISVYDNTAIGKMNYLIQMGAKITPEIIDKIENFISAMTTSSFYASGVSRFRNFLKKHTSSPFGLSESLENIFKPKEGALEELEKWSFKNLMQPTPFPDGEKEWLELNKNLARELNYKGIKDSEEGNIVGFEIEETRSEFPGSDDLFDDVAIPYFISDYSVEPEFSGGLTLDVGHWKDGSKVIYYQGGLIDGYIARKEWLK